MRTWRVFKSIITGPLPVGLWSFCMGSERRAESVMSFLLLWEENTGKDDERQAGVVKHISLNILFPK